MNSQVVTTSWPSAAHTVPLHPVLTQLFVVPGSGAGSTNNCVKTGCSGTVCAAEGHEVVTTCEFKPEYACYQTATCEKQADGQCGWTQTPALTGCLANPPPAAAAAGSDAPVM